jgi:hypothetical protein
MNKKDRERMEGSILKHGLDLISIFPECIEKEPAKLCKKLIKIERKASKLSTDYCNGVISSKVFDTQDAELFLKLKDTLGEAGPIVFINSDPRGYALKIDDSSCKNLSIYKDWGGYGIIAPDFTPY